MKYFISISNFLISIICFSQNPELVIPLGNSFEVKSVCISSDSKYIFNSSGYFIKMWDTFTGREIRTLKGHEAEVKSIAISPGNKYLLSGGDDRTLKLWEISSGNQLWSIEEIPGGISTVCFSPDGKFALAGTQSLRLSYDTVYNSAENAMLLIDIENGSFIYSFEGHLKGVSAVDFSPDGLIAISGSEDGTIKLWDIESKNELKSFVYYIGPEFPEGVRSLKFSEDGKSIILGGAHFLILYDINSLKVLKKYDSQEYPFSNNSVEFSPDGKYILSSGPDSLLRLWDRLSEELVLSFNGHKEIVQSACFSPDGRYIISGSRDRTVRVWSIATGNEVRCMKTYTDRIFSSSFMSDGKSILLGGGNEWSGTLKIWNMADLKKLSILKGHKVGVVVAKESNNGNYIASAGEIIMLWDIQSKQLYKSFSNHRSKKTSALVFTPDDSLIISCGDKEEVCLWDIESGTDLYDNSVTYSLTKEKKHIDNISSVLIAPNSQEFITASWDGTFKKSNIDYGIPNYTSGLNRSITSMSFSPDKKYLLTGSIDSILRLWQYDPLTMHKKFIGHKRGIYSVDYSSDGNLALSGGLDGAIKVWDIESTKEIISFDIDTDLNLVCAVDFSPDNEYILSSSFDFYTRLWSIKNEEEIARFVSMGELGGIVLTPDNYYYCTKDALDLISFKIGDSKIVSVNQFDIQYNRPDIVLERIGLANSETIEIYRKAYYKRLKKMNIDESMFSPDFHTPEIEILERDKIPYISSSQSMTLDVKAIDSKNNIDRINLWINNIPVYGLNGISVKNQATGMVYESISIELSEGNNKIQVSCMNNNSVQSLKETIEITYEPTELASSDMYIVSLSVSEYFDKSMNLKYAVKDGRDLSSLLTKSKNFENIYIDTLFDLNATKENIINLKQKLLNTNVDDQVILFVSGHGLLDGNFDFYFATHDIDFDNPAERGVSYDQLEWLLDSIPARKKLFMMDACHSGEVDKDELIASNDLKERDSLKKGIKSYTYRAKVLEEDKNNGIGLQNSFELMQELFTNLNRGSGAVVISAAAGDSYALESDEWNNGVFTYSVLDGIKNEHADLNNNGEITVSELRNYVSKKVQEETDGRQKPTVRQENVEFDFRIW